MKTLLADLMAQAAWRDVVIVLLHTLWQAPVIAIIAYVLLRAVPARRPGVRYAVCVLSLALVVMSAAGTWALITRPGDVTAFVAAAPEARTSSPSTAVAPEAAMPANATAPSAMAVRADWITIASGVWCCGVALMLVRIAFLVAGARRVTRQAMPLEDRGVLAIIDRLRQRLRISRNVRVLVTQRLISPAVVGIVRPSILLPASLLSGVPADQLEAILLHELAHIRRWDYLVNLIQLFIEALLFFNPAVWWMSRQIRIEREACCDAVAVRLTDRPVRYAEALADWLSTMRDAATPQLAMAMSGSERKPTLDRVSRILLPGYRPRLRLSWPSLIAVLLTSALLLAGVWRGTEAAVTLAAEILSPQQRMEKLIAATQSSVPVAIRHSDKREDRVKFSCTVRTIDGKPLPRGGWVYSDVSAMQHSTFASHGEAKPQFDGDVSPGILYLGVSGVPGYAPKSAGPFTGLPGTMLDPIEIVLEPGFTAQVKFQDDAGQPVPDAKLGWHVEIPGGGGIHDLKPDAQGILTFDNAIDATYSLTAVAPGFETDKREVRFKPNETIPWTLKRAAATSIVVLDPAGKPIAGATAHKFAELEGEKIHAQDWSTREILATTDADGRFTLSNLRRDRSYVLLLQTPDKRQALVRDVKAGQTDRRVQLSPPRVIRGRVTGDLSRLVKEKDKPVVRFAYTFRTESHAYSSQNTPVPVTIEGDSGTFEIHDPLPLPIGINAGNAREVTVDASNPPAEPVVITLAAAPELPKREVIVRLLSEPGAPPPRGVLVLVSSDKTNPQKELRAEVDLKDGQAKFTAYAGAKMRVSARNLVGAWVAGESYFGKEYEIPAGDGPYTLEIPTIPAGAITGTITMADGKAPPDNVTLLGVYTITPSPLLGSERFSFEGSNHPAGGKFMLTPLPLGGTYRVMASHGKTRVFSDEIKVDASNPLANVALKFPRGVDVEVKVLDPSGAPVAHAPVEFGYESPWGGHGYSNPPVTDAAGTVRFEAINPEVPGKYTISIPSRSRYQPAKVDLKLDGQPTIIKLEHGLPLKGRVIVQPAGKPLAGAEVMATKIPLSREFQQFKAEAKSNDKGEFTFSNLAPGEYRVRADPPSWPGQPYSIPETEAAAGQEEEVEVVIKLVAPTQ